MEHKNLPKKNGVYISSLLPVVIFVVPPEVWEPSNGLCEVTAGMAFGSIAVVAVNRLMTMMFGKRVVFPTTHLSTSPKVIGPNWYFYKKWGMEFYFFSTDKIR